MKHVSIIIPAYKRVEQTVRTVELLRASNGWGSEFEAEVIVADNSPDEELKQKLEAMFGGKVQVLRQQQNGIASAKNAGAKAAKHPILIFCDSDMEVEPSTIRNTLIALERCTTAAAVGGQVIWRGGPHDRKHDRPRPEDRMEKIHDTTYIEALYSRFIATYKKVFWQVGGYDEVAFNMRGEGSDLSIRYWRAGFPLVYDENIVVHHEYEVEGGIIRGVDHPEWAIAKDLLLLGYKYDMFEGSWPNFARTVGVNFAKLTDGYFLIIQGIGKHLDFITDVKKYLDQYKSEAKPTYDFKFLEVFSQEKLFEECIAQAQQRIHQLV